MHRIVVTLIVLMAAGCFGDRPQGDTDPTPAPATQSLNATACDGPLLPQRVRAREIDVATDPNEPDRLAVGLIVSTPPTRTRAPHDWPFWNGLARSEDGGATWTLRTEGGWEGDTTAPPSRFAGNVFLTDPIVLYLSDGTLLFSGLAVGNGVELYVQRFAPGSANPESTSVVARGALITNADAHELVGTPAFTIYNDKQQLAEDPFTKAVYVTWMWRTTGQNDDRAMPMISRSTDGGRTWSEPKPVFPEGHWMQTDGGFHVGAWPFVTADGTLHVVWWDGKTKRMLLATSPDHGVTFGAPRSIADAPTTFSQPGGVIQLGIPSVDVDRTNGSYGGTVYVTWEDRRNGDRDVILVYSRDNGTTWDAPVRVNDDEVGNGKDQFMPQLVVEPSGAVSVLFMDRRNDERNQVFLAYIARSVDGGQTFANYPIASKATDPALVANSDDTQPDPLGRTRLGDYNGIAYNRGGLVAVWQDGRDATASTPFSAAYACKAAVTPLPAGEPSPILPRKS